MPQPAQVKTERRKLWPYPLIWQHYFPNQNQEPTQANDRTEDLKLTENAHASYIPNL